MLYIEIIRQAVSVSDIFLLVGKPEIEILDDYFREPVMHPALLTLIPAKRLGD